MCIEFNRSVNSLAVSEFSSRQKIRSILGLSNVKTVCGMSNLKAQEIAEMSKIFHLKLLIKKILEFLNAIEVITSYGHIIHIKEKQNGAFISVTKKQGRIIRTGNVAQAKDSGAELDKPSSWSLFKAIKCTSKMTNLVLFNKEIRRRLHIEFFTQIPIKSEKRSHLLVAATAKRARTDEI